MKIYGLKWKWKAWTNNESDKNNQMASAKNNVEAKKKWIMKRNEERRKMRMIVKTNENYWNDHY